MKGGTATMGFRTFAVASAVALGLAVQPGLAAAQTDYGAFNAAQITGKTEVEKAIGRCAFAVLAGAALGAAASENRGRGAATGAAIGGVVCVAMLSIASANDKARLREAQLAALNTGQIQHANWTTTENKAASAMVSAGDVVEVSARKSDEVVKCRRVNTQLDVDGQTNATSDVVCLRGDSWVTLDKLKPMGIRPTDVQV